MERVGAKETKSTGRSGKYFRAVVTPNREKPKEEEAGTVIDRLIVSVRETNFH